MTTFGATSDNIMFSKLVNELSLLKNNWFKDDHGAVIVPNDLFDAEKRYLIRFLLAVGKSVVIADACGGVREPMENEIDEPDMPCYKMVRKN